MAVKQVSVLIQNEEGSLSKVINALANGGIDLRAMSIADTENYGILRLIVDDTAKAVDILNNSGYPARIKELTAFAIPDQPGGLAHVLNILDESDINIEYTYSLITRDKDYAYTVIRVADNDVTERVLREHGIRILEEEDI